MSQSSGLEFSCWSIKEGIKKKISLYVRMYMVPRVVATVTATRAPCARPSTNFCDSGSYKKILQNPPIRQIDTTNPHRVVRLCRNNPARLPRCIPPSPPLQVAELEPNRSSSHLGEYPPSRSPSSERYSPSISSFHDNHDDDASLLRPHCGLARSTFINPTIYRIDLEAAQAGTSLFLLQPPS